MSLRCHQPSDAIPRPCPSPVAIAIAILLVGSLLSISCDSGGQDDPRPPWEMVSTGADSFVELVVATDTLWRAARDHGLWALPLSSNNGMFEYVGLADSSEFKTGNCMNDPCSGVVSVLPTTVEGLAVLFATTSSATDAIFRRVSSGTWRSSSKGAGPSVKQVGRTQTGLVAISGGGVFRSSAVDQWSEVLSPNAVGQLASDPSSCDVFVGAGAAIGFSPSVTRSSDCGHSWEDSSLRDALPNSSLAHRITADYSVSPTLVVAHDHREVAVSHDGGVSWLSVPVPVEARSSTFFGGVVIESGDPARLWLSTRNEREVDGRLFYSSDDGLTWTRVDTEIPDGFRIGSILWDDRRGAMFVDAGTALFTYYPQ